MSSTVKKVLRDQLVEKKKLENPVSPVSGQLIPIFTIMSSNFVATKPKPQKRKINTQGGSAPNTSNPNKKSRTAYIPEYTMQRLTNFPNSAGDSPATFLNLNDSNKENELPLRGGDWREGQLLAPCVPPQKYDWNGNYWLHKAAIAGDLDRMHKWLKKAQSKNILDQAVNTWNSEGLTPLHVCVGAHGKKYLQMLESCYRFGGNLNVTTYCTNKSLLHLAVEKRKTKEDLQKIVSLGVDFNAKDSDGNTILHYLSTVGDAESLAHFISIGMDVNAKNKFDETPFDAARKSICNYLEIAGLLLANGAIVP